MPPTVTIIVAAITAMPPPWGVGLRWEDRAFGRARAWRRSSGSSNTIKTLLKTAATVSAPAPAQSRNPASPPVICPPLRGTTGLT